MKTLVFSKRNFKEILRDPISLIFCFVFPIGVLLLLELIMSSIPASAQAQVPQFEINNLTSSICVFSFSFLTLFTGMLIAKDRTTSFQSRLLASPMKATNFVLGYFLPLFPVALVQIAITFISCFFFNLAFSWNLLLAVVVLIPSAILFISLGIIIGSIFSDKAVGGIASIIVNLSAILGGMFFPLETMSGAIVNIANVLPFAPALRVCKYALIGSYSKIGTPLLIICAYAVVTFGIAILIFNKKFLNRK